MAKILSEEEFFEQFEKYCAEHNLPVTKVIINGKEYYKGIRLLSEAERRQRNSVTKQQPNTRR